eukprot:2249194-Pleurochrysis_carterae.AAC.8
MQRIQHTLAHSTDTAALQKLCFRDGHGGEADMARDSVPGTQERDDAIRAHRCEDDIISIHEGGVHASIVNA